MQASGRTGWFLRGLGRLYLRISGWRVEGRFPDAAKTVVIAAPHTSNWDMPLMLAMAWVLDVRPAWLGKQELFRRPFGWFMRRLGGVPVDRTARQNTVRQAVERFDALERLHLVIPPSGTRSRATHWRSGFYHIAREANVPIVLGYLDYARRRGGFGPELHPSGDLRADMDAIRRFYADKTGRHPEQFGPVRLAEET